MESGTNFFGFVKNRNLDCPQTWHSTRIWIRSARISIPIRGSRCQDALHMKLFNFFSGTTNFLRSSVSAGSNSTIWIWIRIWSVKIDLFRGAKWTCQPSKHHKRSELSDTFKKNHNLTVAFIYLFLPSKPLKFYHFRVYSYRKTWENTFFPGFCTR